VQHLRDPRLETADPGLRLVEPVPKRRRLPRVGEVQEDQDRDGDDRREADVISDGVDELMDR
jgi:hypothetical protein